MLSRVWLYVTLWTVGHQAPLSMGFPGKNAEVGSHSLSRESSQLRDWIQASHIVGRFLTIWATKEAPKQSNIYVIRVQEGGKNGRNYLKE